MSTGKPLELPAQCKDTLHRKGNIFLPRRSHTDAASLSAQKVKANSAHIAEIVCHLDDAGERRDILNCDDCGQTDLLPACREALNPCDHRRGSPAPVGKAAECIVHIWSAVEAHTDTNARIAENIRSLIGDERPVRLNIHARPYAIPANIVRNLHEERQCEQRLTARELEDEGSAALRCKINGTSCRVP